jgi:hypothetical protein
MVSPQRGKQISQYTLNRLCAGQVNGSVQTGKVRGCITRFAHQQARATPHRSAHRVIAGNRRHAK